MLPALLRPVLAAALVASSAAADVPRVAADVAPVHSLVARVMAGLGEPALVVPPGSSPHAHALRPSEAAALQEADLVFWVGPDLTPWLGDALATLASNASTTALLEHEGTVRLDLREDALFGPHDDAAPHDHGDDVHGDHDHAHGAHDPHAWLMPDNAAAWMAAIAESLATADPANAAAYRANAAEGADEVAALSAEIDARLDPVRGARIVVFHDAYQYLERAFGIETIGAIALSDATPPSPARIAAIRARIGAEGIDCVLSEPQFDPALVSALLDGTSAETGILDPLGAALEPGPALYPDLMRALADGLATCR